MPRTHLTDLSIKALKPTGKQVTHWDENLAGFGVRVSQKGTKTFVVMVGKERKLISLGRYPHLSLKTARTEAQKHFNAPTTSLATITVSEAYSNYLDLHVALNYSEHWSKQTRSILSRRLSEFDSVPINEVSTHHLTHIIDGLAETPSAANHAHAVFKTFFAWCATRRLITHSPLQGIPKPHKETARARTLSDDEVAALWEATHEHTVLIENFIDGVQLFWFVVGPLELLHCPNDKLSVERAGLGKLDAAIVIHVGKQFHAADAHAACVQIRFVEPVIKEQAGADH